MKELSGPLFFVRFANIAEKAKTDKSVFDEQVDALRGNCQLHEKCNFRDEKLFVNPPIGVRSVSVPRKNQMDVDRVEIEKQ
ncbi:hypothetical protein [Limnohabitans sp.]|jgi:hypothetical protein